jgi:pyruvate dehydrogenase E1 component
MDALTQLSEISRNPRLTEPPDVDPSETSEWLDALASAVRAQGEARGAFLLARLEERARELGILPNLQPCSPYVNTIPPERQPPYPGDLALEARITAILRWNALAMVVRANEAHGELGGHLSSYASAAELFETGFHHVFRAAGEGRGGDLVFFQPHSAPGIYARAFLEGRLSEEQLTCYRREVGGRGLSSYPHPWLMPEFWQFSTGSMGVGPINAIYQARFMRYLEHRGLADTEGRHVWGIFGDGEMDEPEAIGALTLAAREELDNLTFVVNCNLQRLDGPVRGNGQIVQELESLFTGAGWNVIKVLWSSDWDSILARDRGHALLRRFAATVDGEYQTLGAKDGEYNLAHFFRQDPEVHALVAHLSDREVDALRRGGHDPRKLHAAYRAALAERGRPTLILAMTKKGYGMGPVAESRMTAHQAKKLDLAERLAFRDRFALPISDDDAAALRFWRPPETSPESEYLRARRAALGGSLPSRRSRGPILPAPHPESWAGFALAAGGKEMSTTVAFARLLGNLLRDPVLGPRIVPIVADEARTFGMANLFQRHGIYSPAGQRYEPEDAGSVVGYREARDGQILEEGITEAGALSSWTAAATAYSVHGLPMLPFYVYYSMFGFQRVGDLIWAAADQRARGFLIGATAGRTTLGGEGLQHQDGSSHLVASTIPTCRAYDPAYASELAVILTHGIRRLCEQQADEIYYLTVMNESYPQPSLPAGAEEGVIRGMYLLGRRSLERARGKVRLLGSGAILRELLAAADLLAEDWGVESEVFSVTSFTELAREAREVERASRLHPEEAPGRSYLEQLLAGAEPVVAATDYVRAYPQLVAPYVPARFVVLGTDGFGRSDTREALRDFFEVDRRHVALAALDALARDGVSSRAVLGEAIRRYGIDPERASPIGA